MELNLQQLRTGAVQEPQQIILAEKAAKNLLLYSEQVAKLFLQLEAYVTVRHRKKLEIVDIDKERCQQFVKEWQKNLLILGQN